MVSVHCVAAHTGVSTPRHAPPVTSERVQRLLRPTPERHALSTSETQKNTQHTSIHVQQPTAHRARARLQMHVVAQPFHGLRADTPCTLVCSREGRRALMVGELPPSAASRRRRRRELPFTRVHSQQLQRFTIQVLAILPAEGEAGGRLHPRRGRAGGMIPRCRDRTKLQDCATQQRCDSAVGEQEVGTAAAGLGPVGARGGLGCRSRRRWIGRSGGCSRVGRCGG